MIVLKALYFALPIYVANMAPVLLAGIPFLGQPIDGNKLWRGKPILGTHKTWRGLIGGILFALLIILLQSFVQDKYELFKWLSLIDYQASGIVLLGVLMGTGALIGDAVKSFFKRRLNRPSGSPWVPFDQLDFIIGGLLFASAYAWPGWQVALILLILTPLLHALTNLAAYAVGLKSVPW